MSTRANSMYWPKAAGGRLRERHAAQATGPLAAQTTGNAQELAQARSTTAAHRRRQERSRASFRVREDSDAGSGPSGHSRDLLVSGGQGQAQSHRTTRRTLSAAQQPHRRRSRSVVDALRATDPDRECVPLVEKRTEHPAHRSSTGTSGRRTRSGRVPGLQSASHLEEPPDDARAGIDAGCGVRKAGDDPNGRGVDSHGGWPVAGDAAAHAAGARRASTTEPDSDHASISTTAADQGLSDQAKIGRRPFPVVKTFG